MAKPIIGQSERRAVNRVLKSGQLTQGAEVAKFEENFSSTLLDGRQCVAVNSGTSALHLALLSLGIGAGDEVIVPSFTFAATANAVALAGAIPIFADIEPKYFGLSLKAMEEAIGPRTRGVIPVHLYGHPVDLRGLASLCNERGILLIEDAAQAHGAAWLEQAVGTWGHAAAFSFYPTKNMTTGEGGMISFAQSDSADRARLLRNQGQRVAYENKIVGLNNRMTDFQAAIGREQLKKLEKWNQKRRTLANIYSRELCDHVQKPAEHDDGTHVYHQYTIRVEAHLREELQDFLLHRQIQTKIFYPRPVHTLEPFQSSAKLPETDRASQEVLSLPIHPSLRTSSVLKVADSVNAFFLSEFG